MNLFFLKKVSTIVLFSFLIIFVVFLNRVSAEEEVNVFLFGATGNGKVDETEFIQKAIDSQSEKGGGKVYFPKGIYLIDATKSIVLKDDIDLIFDEGAILKVLPNDKDSYRVLKIHDVNNSNILGSLEIIGDRDDHEGTTGQWGFGISIRGSNNITVENVKISKCWGDGIYVGSTALQNYNKNINIINPVLDNNRRQGISIISAINLKIINAVITNTNGHPPQSGIDIEPNDNKEQVKNIEIINLSTNNNKGYGLIVSLKKLQGSVEPISIYVDRTTGIKDRLAAIGFDGLNGTINFAGYYYLADREIVAKPIVNPVTDRSTQIVGTAAQNAIVTAIVDGKVIGSAKANAQGTYSIIISKQSAGKSVSIIAEDQFGNLSKEIILKVAKFSGDSPIRIAGKNRYETAVAISQKGWVTSGTAVLATGSDFPDALAGGPLAYQEDAPILLTKTKSLTAETKQEIQRLKAKKVIILGSAGAVSQEVESELKRMGLSVERVGGKTRFETAALIAGKLNSDRAVVANGLNFPDVLSVSSYAAKNGVPILLTRTDRLPDETKSALSDVSSTYVIGSTGAVSKSVSDQLPKPTRYGGKNRYETGYEVATKLPLGHETAYIATGANFPDALAGSVLAAKNDAPILLVRPTAIPEATNRQLAAYEGFSIFGGTGAVSDGVMDLLDEALKQ